MDPVLEELYGLFREVAGADPETVVPLPRSGSNRSYLRLSCAGGTRSLIGTTGSDVSENKAFIELSRHFGQKGLPVPQVLAHSNDYRVYLQQDLGGESLYDAVAQGRQKACAAFLNRTAAGGVVVPEDVVSAASEDVALSAQDVFYSPQERQLLRSSVAALADIQFAGAQGLDFGVCHPVKEFDGMSVMFDLNYFKYMFLKLSGTDFNEVRLEEDFRRFRDDLLQRRGETFMYRDFQARNVMLVDGKPWFIDFQGGRKGPVYYDLASFVWQARACYPTALKEELVGAYLEAAGKYGLKDSPGFRESLRLFVLFRTLQVLGAYGFRGWYERKRYFIENVPFALAGLRELLSTPFEAYPYLSEVLSAAAAAARPSGTMGTPTAPVGTTGPSGTTGTPTAPIGTTGTAGPQGLSGTTGTAATPGATAAARLVVEITSFSFKRGLPQDCSGNGGGYIFDCRALNNPGRYAQYRTSTGRDAGVRQFLENDGGVFPFLEHVYGVVDPHIEVFLSRGFTHLSVGFGCTGGQHRSVYCAESLASHLSSRFGDKIEIVLTHKEL